MLIILATHLCTRYIAWAQVLRLGEHISEWFAVLFNSKTVNYVLINLATHLCTHDIFWVQVLRLGEHISEWASRSSSKQKIMTSNPAIALGYILGDFFTNLYGHPDTVARIYIIHSSLITNTRKVYPLIRQPIFLSHLSHQITG
jgi:hypothetical protein